jgi:hypothetical protein
MQRSDLMTKYDTKSEHDPDLKQEPPVADVSDPNRTLPPIAPDTKPRDIVLRMQFLIDANERDARLIYLRALEMIECVTFLKLATNGSGEPLLSPNQWYALCYEGGVGTTNAKRIIQQRMASRRQEIIAKVNAEKSEHNAKEDYTAFVYPTLTQLLDRYKPKPTPKRKDDSEEEAASNRPMGTVRAENLQMQDERNALLHQLADEKRARQVAEQQARNERMEKEHIEDRLHELGRERDALSKRVVDLEQRLAGRKSQPDSGSEERLTDKRAAALIVVRDFPERWPEVASRVNGDLKKFGWIRLMDNSQGHQVVILTEAGKAQLRGYSDNCPE